MRLADQDDDFQIDTIARLPKTMVAFDAYRTSEINGQTVIPYDAFEVEMGGGMNLATGVFTAPVSGIYVFTGTWFDNSRDTDTGYAWVYIRKNGSLVIGAMHSGRTDVNSFGMTVLVSLVKGDTVATDLDNAHLFSDDHRRIHFTGQLIYPM
jgi:hypothetical protein